MKIDWAAAGMGGLAVAGTLLTYMLGGWDGLLAGLTLFVGIDYITGVFAAIVKKELSSEKGRKGIYTKVGNYVVVMVCNIVDQILLPEPWLRTLACWWFITTEGISILENLAVIGVQLPPGVVETLADIRDRLDQKRPPKTG